MKKEWLKLLYLFAGIVLLLILAGLFRLWFNTKTCIDFPTQAAAQRAYDKNPAKYSKLDGDHDGKPCESLRGGD